MTGAGHACSVINWLNDPSIPSPSRLEPRSFGCCAGTLQALVPGLPQKTDLVPRRERARLDGLLRSLNPRAEVVQTVGSAVDLSHIINTHRFDMEAAQQGAGWLAVRTSVSPNQRFPDVLRIAFLSLDPLHYTLHTLGGRMCGPPPAFYRVLKQARL